MSLIDDARRKLWDRIQRKRLAYLHTFCGPDGRPLPEAEIVLADLRKFCGIDKGGLVVSPTTRQTDPYATIYRAALRDVYLRIAGFIELDPTSQAKEPDTDERPQSAAN